MIFKIKLYGGLHLLENSQSKLLIGQIIRIPPHPRAKLLSPIWKLNMVSKIKYLAWKLVRGEIPRAGNLRTIGFDINGDCPFC